METPRLESHRFEPLIAHLLKQYPKNDGSFANKAMTSLIQHNAEPLQMLFFFLLIKRHIAFSRDACGRDCQLIRFIFLQAHKSVLLYLDGRVTYQDIVSFQHDFNGKYTYIRPSSKSRGHYRQTKRPKVYPDSYIEHVISKSIEFRPGISQDNMMNYLISWRLNRLCLLGKMDSMTPDERDLIGEFAGTDERLWADLIMRWMLEAVKTCGDRLPGLLIEEACPIPLPYDEKDPNLAEKRALCDH